MSEPDCEVHAPSAAGQCAGRSFFAGVYPDSSARIVDARLQSFSLKNTNVTRSTVASPARKSAAVCRARRVASSNG